VCSLQATNCGNLPLAQATPGLPVRHGKGFESYRRILVMA
jgi:hypothetical protein